MVIFEQRTYLYDAAMNCDILKLATFVCFPKHFNLAYTQLQVHWKLIMMQEGDVHILLTFQVDQELKDGQECVNHVVFLDFLDFLRCTLIKASQL